MKSVDPSCKHSATNICNIKYGIAQESSLIYLQIENHETIDVTFGGVFDHIGLKDSNNVIFSLTLSFWFHNLNSMVPVRGIILLNLVF